MIYRQQMLEYLQIITTLIRLLPYDLTYLTTFIEVLRCCYVGNLCTFSLGFLSNFIRFRWLFFIKVPKGMFVNCWQICPALPKKCTTLLIFCLGNIGVLIIRLSVSFMKSRRKTHKTLITHTILNYFFGF